MSLTVKAYLDRGTENPEIRRFAVDQSVSTSLAYLKGKIAQVFPSLNNKQYNLFWKDSDNDLVSFSSDDELTEALGFVSDGVFRVYIRPDQENQSGGVVHKGVVCDGCEKEIHGARYKCVVCPDYDLCAGCEHQSKHNQHEMLRMCTPSEGRSSYPFMGFPFMHGGPPHGGPPHGGPPHGGPPHGGPHGGHPPPPPGPDGCGEGGPWGHPWRRMMKRCWRRMMREQWGAPDFPGAPGNCDRPGSRDSSVDSNRTAQSGEGEASSSKAEQQGEGNSADAREEYLRNMGDSVAAMLDPLGIDVHVDIEHNGQQKHVQGGAQGRHGRGRGRRGCGRGGRGGPWRGGQGMFGMFGGPWGMGAHGAWGPPPPPPPFPQHQQQQEEEQSKGDGADKDVEMQQDTAGEGSSKAQEMNVESPAAPSEEGAEWTVVNKDREEDEQMKSSPAPPQAQNPEAQVLYPQLPPVSTNPRIVDALAQMKAMGYSDDGGWLSSLLEAKGGNINQVLDSLQPKQH